MWPWGGYYGKYRGKVASNTDPSGLGYVQVTVPAVLADVSVWAAPCSPYAGPGVGFFCMPPVGANVWVEFEAGNLEKPIWTGGFWDLGGPPPAPVAPGVPIDPKVRIFKTDSINLKIDDKENGGLSLTIGAPAVEKPITITGDKAGYVIKIGDATLSLADKAILSLGSVSLTLDPAATLAGGGASVKLSSNGAEIETSANVSINGGAVSIKNGALQVS